MITNLLATILTAAAISASGQTDEMPEWAHVRGFPWADKVCWPRAMFHPDPATTPNFTNHIGQFWLLTWIEDVWKTNTVVHWPQNMQWKPMGNTELVIDHGVYYLPGGNGILEPGHNLFFDDTNADTRSIETTVTRQRLLSFEFEQRKFSEPLTNETVAHFQVEERRVRTNAWAIIAEADRVFRFHSTNGLPYDEIKIDPIYGMLGRYATNWFEPVATNQIPDTAWYYTNSSGSVFRFQGTNYIFNNYFLVTNAVSHTN